MNNYKMRPSLFTKPMFLYVMFRSFGSQVFTSPLVPFQLQTGCAICNFFFEGEAGNASVFERKSETR